MNSPQNGDQGKSSSNVGAIAGGVIGGLAFLAAAGFVALVIRRRRASRGVINYSRPDDVEHPSTSASIAHASGVRPPEMRLYVGFFFLPLNSPSDLRTDRIRLTHSPTRIELTTG